MTKSRKPYPSETLDRFIVRFPEGMRDRIREDADTQGRSMNAQIIHMLQSYYEYVAEDLEWSERLVRHGDPEINAALIKVLRFDERSILESRVSSLGGTHAVLKADKSDILKQVEGKKISRTHSENVSYYSKIIGETPVTAFLTTDEIQKIAERLHAIQHAPKG